MNPYEFTHYRALIADQAKTWKKTRPGWTMRKIAEKAQVQPPYLTNVLKERAHLSTDQLCSIAYVFEWDEETLEYALLLQEWERTGQHKRKTQLQEKISRLQKEKRQYRNQLKKEVIQTSPEENQKFFLNPYYYIVNAFLGIPRFAREPLRIANCVSMKHSDLQQILKDLQEMKFIEKTGDIYRKLKRNFHLPKESPLCLPHQTLLQLASTQHMQILPEGEKHNFTLTFSADQKTKEKIHSEFQKFLATIEPMVKDAPSDQIFGLRFDLFRWSHDRD